SDKSPAVRELAATHLGTLRATALVPRLLEVAARDPVETVAAAAVRALGLIGDNRAVVPLLGLLSSGRAQVARDAADALGRIRDPRTRPGLLAVAKAPSAPARAGAVWALGSVLRGHPDPDARKLFIQLARSGDLPLALAAVDAIRASGDPKVAPEAARLA